MDHLVHADGYFSVLSLEHTKTGEKKDYFPVWLFLLHLVVNAAWSIIFFGAQNLLAGMITIVILTILIIQLIKLFYPIQKNAAFLLVPYLVWVSFATLLNFSLLLLN